MAEFYEWAKCKTEVGLQVALLTNSHFWACRGSKAIGQWSNNSQKTAPAETKHSQMALRKPQLV
eukprot:6458307-Amphidinium_carterae.1